MTQFVQAVPYGDRYLPVDGGIALIWPYANLGKGAGPYELFLDTNALNKTRWAGRLPSELREKAILNPWPALMEQWLSNPEFREKPSARIEGMIAPLADMGIRFREGFADEQTALLRKNETQLRTQCSLLFPYVAIMKSLVREKGSPEDAVARLRELTQADVPRFAACIMLTALAVVLKSRQSLRFAGDDNPAYSYLESFLAFQPGRKKGETDRINVPYLRNRAGDLSLWYAVPMLLQQGYRLVGEPVVVTGDKALHRVIFRALPPLWHENRRIAFTIDPEVLDEASRSKIAEAVAGLRIRQALTDEERARRMKTLFDLAKSWCIHPEERDALDEALHEWWKPGDGLELVFD